MFPEKNYNIYIASCEDDGGIYRYELCGGNFTFMEKCACPCPMYMDAEGSSMHTLLMHPFSGKRTSALMDCTILPSGKLQPASAVLDTCGVEACHLCHFAGREYFVNYITGSIGSSAGDFAEHHGSGVNPLRQEAAHTHFIHPTPEGKYLLCCDLGLDTIFTYDSALRQICTAHVPSGHGCRHLTASDDGRFIFCANELMSTVTVFAYSEGTLTPLETVEALPKPNNANTSAAIRMDGNLLYVSQRGEDSISVLIWDGSHLHYSGMYPCGGESPRDFIIVENWLIVTNQVGNSVTVLEREGETLHQTGIRLDVPSPLCAVAIEK